MSFKIGIVGLPNVGKSTLFNALIKSETAEIANYPFCTIDPNVGVTPVPDERLAQLAQIFQSQKIVPTIIEFVDIAGLVAGAAKGEGLGNRFLAHIREVDAICHVIRDFADPQIQHVAATPDPVRDYETIFLELILADLGVAEKRLASLTKTAKTGDPKLIQARDFLQQVVISLEKEIPARALAVAKEDLATFQELQLLTAKPEILVVNVAEQAVKNFSATDFRQKFLTLNSKSKVSPKSETPIVPIAASVEAALADLTEAEKKEFLQELNLPASGLPQLIQAGYTALDLLTFLTAGQQEVHAWTIPRGTLAPQAAGKIHTDFEKGFIRAEVVTAKELIAAGSFEAARAAGAVRSEGKEYVVQDGDVCEFRFR